jgi:hypothetical protein
MFSNRSLKYSFNVHRHHSKLKVGCITPQEQIDFPCDTSKHLCPQKAESSNEIKVTRCSSDDLQLLAINLPAKLHFISCVHRASWPRRRRRIASASVFVLPVRSAAPSVVFLLRPLRRSQQFCAGGGRSTGGEETPFASLGTVIYRLSASCHPGCGRARRTNRYKPINTVERCVVVVDRARGTARVLQLPDHPCCCPSRLSPAARPTRATWSTTTALIESRGAGWHCRCRRRDLDWTAPSNDR